MSLRLTPAEAAKLGVSPVPKPHRKAGELEVLADGHVVHLPYVDVLEKDLDRQVMDLAKRYGWTCGFKDVDELAGLSYHAYSAITGAERGWPDRVFIRRHDRRLIFAELKKDR